MHVYVATIPAISVLLACHRSLLGHSSDIDNDKGGGRSE